MGFWNDENTAQTIELWEEDLSASQIAQRIGATKNTVIGKINRLRSAGHPFKREAATKGTDERSRVSKAGGAARTSKARAKAKPKAPKRKPQNNLAAINMARRAERDAARAAKAQALPPAAIYDATFAKPWTERLFGECAFPVAGEGADTLSCCIGTGGKTYCSSHSARMFRKPDETGKRFVNGVARAA